jgi:hypothetical protein
MTGLMRPRRTWTALLLAIAVGGCATALPPRAPAQDVKGIAGKWELSFVGPDGTASEVTTIREDGTGEWVTVRGRRGTYAFSVRDGLIHWQSSSGRSGSVTLHEGEGKRALTWTLDGCPKCAGEARPVK